MVSCARLLRQEIAKKYKKKFKKMKKLQEQANKIVESESSN